MLRWFRRIDGARGSSSMEQALIAALAATLAAFFAGGVGKTGVNAAAQTQQHMKKASAQAQGSMTQSGPLYLLSISATAANGSTIPIVSRNKAATPNKTSHVNTIRFFIENRSPGPVDLGKLVVEYNDATQRNRLCAGSVTVSGRTISCGNYVSLSYRRGTPYVGNQTNGAPTLKKGDLVEVSVNVGSALARKLADGSKFRFIVYPGSGGRPLEVSRVTPLRLAPALRI